MRVDQILAAARRVLVGVRVRLLYRGGVGWNKDRRVVGGCEWVGIVWVISAWLLRRRGVI